MGTRGRTPRRRLGHHLLGPRRRRPVLLSGATPGEDARGPKRRRARGVGGALGVTFLGALLPGAGILWSGRRLLGLLVLVPAALLVVLGLWHVGRDPDAALEVAFDPARLQAVAAVLAGGLLVWAAIVVATYCFVRPAPRTRAQGILGNAAVLVLCLAVAAPVATGARYALVQADLVDTVFEDDNVSVTTPKHVTEEDPWAGRERVNLLLLGGDGGVNRSGVRTDSMILASMNTRTGRTVMFSLPRNMMNARFPPTSPLHDLYPRGFRGAGDPGFWMLNAVYGQVPALHPGALGRTSNEGADALKQAVAGSLGVPVDYYLLVNLQGFQEIVDAMGGVTVNINEPIPIGGNTDLGVPPDGYLEPGPDQRLDGFEALWYSRGRYGSDDYERMHRQRCMVDALIEEARPLNLFRRYQSLAEAGKRIVRTDVPRELLPAFVDLTLLVKDSSVRSVAFVSSDRFFPGDPDFAWMRTVVGRALTPPERPGGPRGEGDTPSAAPSRGAGTAVEADDICGYDPVS